LAALVFEVVVLSPHVLFGLPWERPHGADALSAVGGFALGLSLLVATMMGAARANGTELSIAYLAMAAAALAMLGRDMLWFAFAYPVLWLLIERSGLSGDATRRRAPFSSIVRLAILTIGLVAIAILSIGYSTNFARLAELASLQVSTLGTLMLGVGVNGFLLVAALVWLGIDASVWRLPVPFAVRSAMSFGSSLAVYVVFVRFMSWLPDIGAYLSGRYLLSVLGMLAMVVAGVRAYRARTATPFLSAMTMAHVGLAVVGVTAGVAGRAAGLHGLVSAYAAIVGLAVALDVVDVEAKREESFRVGSSTSWLMRLSLASLATLPPLPVFIAKLLVLEALFGQERWAAFIVVLGSSAAVTVSSLVHLFWSEKTAPESEPGRGVAWVTAGLGVAATFALGVFPDTALRVASAAISGFF
jgi:formate hydrogenlyase subunit 3/multisubunit Na+/H+ antiporter MnhD subunit